MMTFVLRAERPGLAAADANKAIHSTAQTHPPETAIVICDRSSK
jgi:hypothetical protein